MSATTPSLETLLRKIAAASPPPWYPAAFARETGVARDSLDEPLEKLRMAGLVQLTDWVSGKGQGYAVTPEGEQVLRSPRDLGQLQNGHFQLRVARPEAAFPAPTPAAGGSDWERGEAVRDALLRPTEPVVTKVLIGSNILVFVAGLALALSHGVTLDAYIGGSGPGVSEIILMQGGLRGSEVLRGQWWRLLTCCFVHFGILHLLVNMYSLYVIGPMTERMWGRWRYLIIYFLAGLWGSGGMLLNDSRVLGAGASGALWGIMSSLLVWTLLNRRYLPPALTSAWLRSLLIVFILNVVISIAPGISAAAHFIGGLGGALSGILVYYDRFGSILIRWLARLGLVGMAALCVGSVALWEVEITRLTQECDTPVILGIEKALDTYDNWVAPAVLVRDASGNLQPIPPANRDPRRVEVALKAVAHQREFLLSSLKAVEQSGPFYTPDVFRTRARLEQLLQACLQVDDLAERVLKGEGDWQANVNDLVNAVDGSKGIRGFLSPR